MQRVETKHSTSSFKAEIKFAITLLFPENFNQAKFYDSFVKSVTYITFSILYRFVFIAPFRVTFYNFVARQRFLRTRPKERTTWIPEMIGELLSTRENDL